MSPIDRPSEQEVWAQYARICEHKLFVRSRKLRLLLEKLIDRWFFNGGKDVDEGVMGDAMGETRVPEEQETAEHHGFPQTRANLSRLRNGLTAYFETKGYLDPVVIKLNKGSYIPVVAYNRNLPLTSKLDPYCDRLILRAKTLVDTRNFSNLERIVDYIGDLRDSDSTHPRAQANIPFLMYAVAPSFPRVFQYAEAYTAAAMENLSAIGAQPWELAFAEACLHSARDHEWLKALGLFQTAVANSHGEASYFWWYTAILATVGSIDEAIEILDQAVHHFARTNVAVRLDLALLLIIAKRYTEADEILFALTESGGGQAFIASAYFMISLEAQNKLSEALEVGTVVDRIMSSLDTEALQVFYQQCGWNFVFWGIYGLVLGRSGEKQRALNIYNHLARMMESSEYRSSLFEMALPFIGLQSDGPEPARLAIKMLESVAFEWHDPIAMWFHIFPPLRHLHDFPEFQSLLSKLHLPPRRKS
jgi:tetratricopeptide (TPR) repeat protein